MIPTIKMFLFLLPRNSRVTEYNIDCQPLVAKAGEYWEGGRSEYVELHMCGECVFNIYKMDLDFACVCVYVCVWGVKLK